MINTLKMKGRIVEKGKTIQYIAEKVGCTAYSLGQKISNKTPMTLEEAYVLCDELEITTNEFEEYFFAQDVAKCNK